MRAAIVHVVADAAVSVMVIVGLLLARAFGWLWMDAVAGIFGACVISSWAYGLVRDTGAILLDMNPDEKAAENLRAAIEQEGDRLVDLHLWRLGPGHLGAILSVTTAHDRGVEFYRARLIGFRTLSHITVEVMPALSAEVADTLDAALCDAHTLAPHSSARTAHGLNADCDRVRRRTSDRRARTA